MTTQRYALFIVCIIFMQISYYPIQADNFAASAQIIGESIIFIRDNAQNELTLPAGAVTALGIDDRIRTGANGRVLITFSTDNVILLLPNSEFHLTDFSQDEGQLAISAILNGIAVHQFLSATDPFTYQLDSAQDTLTVTTNNQQPQHFATWSIENGLQAVTVARGAIDLFVSEQNNPIQLTDNTGFAVSYSDAPISIEMPLHPAGIIRESTLCRGTISTSDARGLRVRGGAALDYVIVDVRFNGDPVSITGTTENGLWYRVPFQTGFGWMFSNLIATDCLISDIPIYPNLVREDPESITNISEQELVIVQPFYGTPSS
ncbi:MAG: SH3 domain-containing protein, partial [Phototrophicaceae bacterium]